MEKNSYEMIPRNKKGEKRIESEEVGYGMIRYRDRITFWIRNMRLLCGMLWDFLGWG